MKSQWECFLENLAVWEGSFATFSPQGELLKDTPSRLTLEGYNNNQNARLTLQLEGERDMVLELSPQGIGGIMFFENGGFSQGPMQFSRFSLFGGELGLIYENHRSRLVQIFDSNSTISKIIVIREHKAGTEKRNVLRFVLMIYWENGKVKQLQSIPICERRAVTPLKCNYN